MKNNITNNDLYNEIKLFIKYFIYEAEKKDKIKHNDNIETLNFQSKIILRPNISFLNCTIQINYIADIYIKVFNKNSISILAKFNENFNTLEDDANLITNDFIKKIYFYFEEVNQNNPIKRKILNIKNF